jgi:hypothetical protein
VPTGHAAKAHHEMLDAVLLEVEVEARDVNMRPIAAGIL